MKVLHIINSLETGGAEKLITELLPRLRENKIDIDLLLLTGKQTPLLKVFESQFKGRIFDLGRSSVYNPAHIFKILRYFAEYDIIHVHLFPALYWTSAAKSLSTSECKLIYTEHSTHNKRRDKPMMKVADKMFYKNFDEIITITDEVKENLQIHFGNTNLKYKTIHNGVNTNKIYSAKAFPKTDFFKERDCKIIIQVSSFREAKDQMTVIRAMSLLPDNIKLLLVGEGPTMDQCKKLASDLNVEHRVKFLGNRMDVPELLKTSDIVVLSSNYEGMSLSSIEGMASGRPFVASKVPGLTDIVEGAGILYEHKNEVALATTLKALLEDEKFYGQTVNQCLERASQFDISTMVKEHIELYHKLLR